ncbi:MAG: hypothetical protein ACJ8R9_22115 [Steroidobacteraceae bacterium]
MKNLKVVLPVGTKLVGACSLRRLNGQRIDLSKGAISLDEYDEQGNLPFGEIFLAGKLEISGTVSVEPGPAGDVWFVPKWGFSRKRSPFSVEMAEFKFETETENVAFRVDERLRSRECSIATAKIRVRGFRIEIGESDEAGTYPLRTEVLEISPYKDCPTK